MESQLETFDSRRGRSSTGLTLVEALLQQEGLSEELSTPLREIQRAIADQPEDERPFLTVLLRTQGRRAEPLKDALLCLAAQTDHDFEVVIIDHNSEPEGAIEVRNAVESQPSSFRNRIRIVEVRGGTRARPLNSGIQVARGRYISVFDDDDLLFADWVEQFHAAASSSGNRLLRAQTATQRARPEEWAAGINGFRTLSWPRAEYARRFDQIAHLLVNHSPFMSLAFPRGLFTQFGLRFDEELAVCEDWDMILRASLLVGVADVVALTSIYRRWDGAASSYTVHSSAIWKISEKRVIDRLNDSVIILPAGSVSEIRGLLEDAERNAVEGLALIINSKSWRWTAPLRYLNNVIRRVKGTYLHHRNRVLARMKR